MGKTYWIRVVVMIITLFGVIIVMRKLNPNSDHSSPSLSWLGLSSSQIVNLCPTRVVGLKGTNGVALLNEDMKWYRYSSDGKAVEVDPVAVEKWFSEHCMVQAEKTDAASGSVEIMTVFFVNGDTSPLGRATTGEFSFMGQNFKSPQLDRAISALEGLPLHTRPSK